MRLKTIEVDLYQIGASATKWMSLLAITICILWQVFTWDYYDKYTIA